ETVTFSNWHFIEDGWDYGFGEALVGGEWGTLEVRDAATGGVVSTDDDPHGNNTEGAGVPGTPGGDYFVDDPVYADYEVAAPAGATDLRSRYSTDAAYLAPGWFIAEIVVGNVPAAVTEGGDWVLIEGEQVTQWVVQV